MTVFAPVNLGFSVGWLACQSPLLLASGSDGKVDVSDPNASYPEDLVRPFEMERETPVHVPAVLRTDVVEKQWRYIGGLAILLVGALTLFGCGSPQMSLKNHSYYPDDPAADDLLAHRPCSVKKEPDIIIKGSEAKLAEARQKNPDTSWHESRTNAEIEARARRSIEWSLAILRKANPTFICGLERIELLGDEEYEAKYAENNPNPGTDKGVAHYSHSKRIIRIRLYGNRRPLIHEVGHHVHNTGYFAPTIRKFLAKGWVWDAKKRRRVHRDNCTGRACFLSEGSRESPTEDWARHFENVLLHPIETMVRSNVSLKARGPTALQRKIKLIFDLISGEKPLHGKVLIGRSVTLETSDVQIIKGSSLYLMDLDQHTVSEYVIDGHKLKRTVHVQDKDDSIFRRMREARTKYEGERTTYQAIRRGNRLFVFEKADYIGPGTAGPGAGFMEFDLGAARDIGGTQYFADYKTLLGNLKFIDGKLSYFTPAPGKLYLKGLDTQSRKTTLLNEWSLPGEFIPFHVSSLSGIYDMAVFAYRRGENDMARSKVYVFRIRKKNSSDEYTVKQGGSYQFQSYVWEKFGPPVPVGNFLLLPYFDKERQRFGLAAYDLKGNRFRGLALSNKHVPAAFRRAAGKFENVELLSTDSEDLYLVGATKQKTLVAPITFRFSK